MCSLYLSPPAVDNTGEGQLGRVVEDHLAFRIDLVAAEAVDEDHLAVGDA